MTTWVKVYNTMPQHPKLLVAGDRAAWLFVCGLCYSNEHLTGGFISRHVLPVAAPGVKNPERLAERLVGAGLWHEVEGGWWIHDYGDHQRLPAEIRDGRAKDSARKAARRSNGTPHVVRAESARPPHLASARIDVDVDVDVDVELPSAAPEVIDLCSRLAGHIRRNDSKANPKPDSERWRSDMRLLVADRGGNVAEVARIVDWSQADPFWRSNILSPAKLRKQFTQLMLKASNVTPLPRPSGKESPSEIWRAINGPEAS